MTLATSPITATIRTHNLTNVPALLETAGNVTEAHWRYFDMSIVSEKRCNKCGEVKAISQFYKTPKGRGGVMAVCISCKKLYSAEYRSRPETKAYYQQYHQEYEFRKSELRAERRKRNPRKYSAEQRRLKLLERYGISSEDYEALHIKQGGVCAICGRENQKGRTYLHIDHDHETGKVRGLLCNNCNSAMGMIYDDPKIALSIYEYLLRSKRGIS